MFVKDSSEWKHLHGRVSTDYSGNHICQFFSVRTTGFIFHFSVVHSLWHRGVGSGASDPCLFQLSFGPDVMKSGRGCGIRVCHSISAEYPVQLCLTKRWVVVFELKVASGPPPLQDASQPRSQSAPLSCRGIWRATGRQDLLQRPARRSPARWSFYGPSLGSGRVKHSPRWLRHCMNSHSLWILRLSPECFRSSQEYIIKVSVRRTGSALNSSAPRCQSPAVMMPFERRDIWTSLGPAALWRWETNWTAEMLKIVCQSLITLLLF